jgi:DNA-binding GntR family transcriptional regulator
VEILAQRGVRLAEFGPAYVRDVYDIREGCEAMALQLAPPAGGGTGRDGGARGLV